MIEYDFGPCERIIEDVRPHAVRHYREMNKGDAYGEPDIDWAAYYQASQLGQCFAGSMRDEGKLVGYAVYSVGTNMRYKSKWEANSDALFIEKEYRGHGKGLIGISESSLKMMGVSEVNYATNDDEFLKFLESIGYKQTYKICSKEL